MSPATVVDLDSFRKDRPTPPHHETDAEILERILRQFVSNPLPRLSPEEERLLLEEGCVGLEDDCKKDFGL